ncbi:MAG TPA: hypothetical protein VKT82_31860 [Ktedonobacterales bacterium]|nr:hypothetical protein [Ktedonobacterales bacterium]
MKDTTPPADLLAEAANIDTPLGRLDELALLPELMPIVAANPATSGETLVKLMAQKDTAVRQAIAGNPNTPVRHLLTLAREFPLEFLSNPVLPLLNLSQPDFIKKLPQDGWLQLLRYDLVPSVWLKWIQQGLILPLSWQRSNLVQELQFHVSIGGEATRGWEKQAKKTLQQDGRIQNYLYRVNTQVFLLSMLAFPGLAAQWGAELRNARTELQRLVLEHTPELDGATLAVLARVADLSVRCAVARHPRAPAKVLLKLIDYGSEPAVRRAAASNPYITVKLLRRLAGDDDATVRQAVAHHPRLTPEVLETLTLDADPTVRAAVALHPRLSEYIYHFLAEDAEPAVRAALAHNVRAPLETLMALAHDAALEVRVALARNPRLPPEVFALLFQGRSTQGEGFAVLLQQENAPVRVALAGNSRLPLPLLEQLAADPDPAIRYRLAANPRTPMTLLETWLEAAISKRDEFAGDDDMPVGLALARNPRATPTMLTTLAEYYAGKAEKSLGIRAAVAAHSQTPVDVLRKLMTHSKPPIRRSLAANPHTPPDVLKLLLATDETEVWVRAAHHPAVIGDQRRMLINLLIEKIREDRTSSSLPTWFFFQQKDLPEANFGRMLTSTSWRDRYCVARSARASQEVLAALAHDGNRFVRMAARTALINRARLAKRERIKRDV